MLALPFPAIDPVALDLGPLTIRWYSLAYIAGLLLGWRFMLSLSSRLKHVIPKATIDDFLVWATLGVIFGGRIGYILFYNPAHFAANPLEIFEIWNGGMSFHGGALGVLAVTYFFCQKRNIPLLALGDLICSAAPIGIFFGRIANFINGELYGRVSDAKWAFYFPNGGSQPRHPSQLYEAMVEGLLLFSLLSLLIFKFGALNRPGLISGIFFLGYGLGRYSIEFFREPDKHLGVFFGFVTMGQALSTPAILAGIWLIWRSASRQ